MNCNYKKESDVVSYDSYEASLAACDLCYLMVLHDHFGFGYKRLHKVLEKLQETYIGYRNRYCLDEDVRHITTRSAHIVALERDLKDQTGMIYEDEIRRFRQENKGRWRGHEGGRR